MSRRLLVSIFALFTVALVSIAAQQTAGPARGGSGTPPAPSSQASRVIILGSVVDESLTPVAGVALTLERGGRVEARTTSDTGGKFRFENVIQGDVRVRAERTGFSPFTRDIKIPVGVTSIQLPVVMIRPGDAGGGGNVTMDGTSSLRSSPANPNAAPVEAPRAVAPAGPTGGAGGGRGGVMRAAVPPPAQGQAAADNQAQIQSSTGERSFMALAREEPWSGYIYPMHPRSGELYAHVDANRFQAVRDQPLSTFGADVDTASYSNVRRFLSSGQLPPADAVRIEELVNYFRFGYGEPGNGRPIALSTEIGDCPWAPSHKLVLIGARAKASAPRETPGRNIVLLIDVSGSMQPAERLPLIKTALGLFADTLRPNDRLAIVTYAGSSGIALPSTEARHRDLIQRAIANLSAGGSTNGGQGLIMAYRTAREAFIPGGVNRVILATDGDFNVGLVSQYDLLRLIERERDSGVFLSVFGVGSGNLKDATMEMLADKGNGHYSYLDSLQEARRVLVREADATLETVAKDVKFQVEFNPAVVGAYKLIGYENRALAAQDFNDDRKDAGEMGAGHTVTVLYEVVPVGAAIDDRRDDGVAQPDVDPLKYQPPSPVARPSDTARPPAVTDAARSGEWLTVKARYKAPEGETSSLISQAVRSGGRVQHLPFASAVAEFGLLLRSQSRNESQWAALARRVDALQVPAAMIADKDGFRELVETARGLARIR